MIEIQGRTFELVKNYRDAFIVEDFDKRYVKEVFDKYDYITGDLSAGLLRLRGFNSKGNKNHFKEIPDFLSDSAAYGCPFYILKRIGGK